MKPEEISEWSVEFAAWGFLASKRKRDGLEHLTVERCRELPEWPALKDDIRAALETFNEPLTA